MRSTRRLGRAALITPAQSQRAFTSGLRSLDLALGGVYRADLVT